jgi:hypothetical protein
MVPSAPGIWALLPVWLLVQRPIRADVPVAGALLHGGCDELTPLPDSASGPAMIQRSQMLLSSLVSQHSGFVSLE